MANKDDIKVTLTAETLSFRRSLDQATGKVRGFGRDLNASLSTFGGQSFQGLEGGVTAVGVAAGAAAVGGLYLFTRQLGEGVARAKELSTATFSMEASLTAANRQFSVGTAAQWESRIKSLGNTLKIYSETDLRNAASRTVDMTKRLGLSADQMEKVIRISGELGAGKTDLVGAVERVTSALRGEAEASEFLGLTLNEDYVKAWHKAHGASKTAWKDLSDLEKAQIRFKVLLEQSTPSLGKSAESIKAYGGAIGILTTEYNNTQTAAGELITNNSFVLESIKILSEGFKEFTENIKANRSELVGMVKNGFLLLVDSVSGGIEVVRFFYNAWQGLSIVAHGAALIMIKGMELTVVAIRAALMPLDLLLSGMEKLGAIDSNPLKDWEKTLGGVADVSLDELDGILEKVLATNNSFDQAKRVVEEYRKKIAEIPAEYKTVTEQIKGSTEKVNQEMRQLADGTWTNRFDEQANKSTAAAAVEKGNLQGVEQEIRKLDNGTYTNRFSQQVQKSNDATAAEKKNLQDIDASLRQLADGTFTNMSEEQRQSFSATAESMKKDIQGVGAVNQQFIDQVKQNIARLEQEAAEGNLGEAALAKLEALKSRLEEILASSTDSQKKDIGEVAESTSEIGAGFKGTFEIAAAESTSAKRRILSDIAEIKKAASEIKYPTASSSSVKGYATGGVDTTGMFIAGERGRELVVTGQQSRIFNNASTNAILRALQSLPRLATGGPTGAASATKAAGAALHLTVNYQGDISHSSTRQNVRAFARQLLPELKLMWEGRG